MSTSEYPNRDILRKANDIYLDVMRSFIIHNLKQVTGEKVEHLVEDALYDNQVDKFHQMMNDHNDVGSAIDFNFIPQIIKKHWDVFANIFDRDLVAQNMLWIIRKGRNSCEHRGNKDLDIELTRAHLYLIENILEEVNRPEKQSQIQTIRNEFLSDNAAKQISSITKIMEDVESEKEKYKKKLENAEKRFSELESLSKTQQKELEISLKKNTEIEKEKKSIEERLTIVSKDLKVAEKAWGESEEKLNSKTKQYEKLVAQEKKNNKQFKSLKKQVNNIKSQRDNAQKTLSSVENELETIKNEKKDTENCLATMQNLLTSVTFNNQFFPPLNIDSNVRIIDRRNTDKKSYIPNLLKLNIPSIFYVNSEEKINQFYSIVGHEKSNLLEKHTDQTSVKDERVLIEKLKEGELLAIVSNSTFSSDAPLHSVEHVVLCHNVLDEELFIKRCKSAFTSNQNTYIHLIYEQNQTDNELPEPYPDRESLVNLYKTLNELVGINANFVKPEKYYSESGSVKPEYETGFAIFEELNLLERTEDGIKLLHTDRKRGLEESEIYREGIQRNTETTEFLEFQRKQPIEKIWEKIAVNDEHESITPPSAIVWSEKTLSAIATLRMRVRKDYSREKENSRNHPLISPHEHVDHLSNVMQKLKLSVLKENGNYTNEYHIAIQFVEVYGIRALQHCIVQLIMDKNDPDYEFSYLEKKMLRAFQMFIQDFNSQSEESDQVTKNNALNTIENTQESEITETKNTTKRSRPMVAVGTV